MFFLNKTYASQDRFDEAKFSEYNVDIYDTLRSFMLYEIPRLPVAGTFSVGDTAGRPDLASFRIYETTSLWWVLLHYNGLRAPSEFTTDIKVDYPSLVDLETLRLSLAAQQGAR